MSTAFVVGADGAERGSWLCGIGGGGGPLFLGGCLFLPGTGAPDLDAVARLVSERVCNVESASALEGAIGLRSDVGNDSGRVS